MGCGQPPSSYRRGRMRSERPEWTVAGGDPLFIGMQNNGQWSVMWGVVGTDSGTVLCFFLFPGLWKQLNPLLMEHWIITHLSLHTFYCSSIRTFLRNKHRCAPCQLTTTLLKSSNQTFSHSWTQRLSSETQSTAATNGDISKKRAIINAFPSPVRLCATWTTLFLISSDSPPLLSSPGLSKHFTLNQRVAFSKHCTS